MEFLRQIWALTWKNLLHLLVRRWFTTPMRALILPVLFVFIFSWSKHWNYFTVVEGVGKPHTLRTFPEAISAGSSLRTKFVIVDNGYKTGDIAQVVQELSATAKNNGLSVHVLDHYSDVRHVCPGSVIGTTSCFGGVEFIASPDHPRAAPLDGIWKYTLLTDAGNNGIRNVFSNHNGVQIYVMPLQHALDDAISRTHGGHGLPKNISSYAYTNYRQSYETQQQNSIFQNNLASYLTVALVIGMIGITYHLPGYMALEREKGFSELIEAMMPNKRRWQPQVARIISYHLTFDLLYFPSWILIAIVLGTLVFPQTNMGILVLGHLLTGLSFTSYSILAASLFRKAHLSGMFVVVLSFGLAIAAQFGFSREHATKYYTTPMTLGQSYPFIVTAAFFPPMTYTYFLLTLVAFQYEQIPASLAKLPPTNLFEWRVYGGIFLAIMIVQALIFPLIAIVLERMVHGTSCSGRKLIHDTTPNAVWTDNLSKHYSTTSVWSKIFCYVCTSQPRVVKAVNNLTLQFVRGSITVLLGANGSGKTTTLSAIAGTTKTTSGTIYVDGTGGLGLCPQRNVLWDDLTVYEHVMIFDLLKCGNDRPLGKMGRQKLISDCDLLVKLHAKAKTLSGGQKRKLQLAMMFVGGSRVCCVDEVSSGIDTLARRKIWDILLAERGRRTIILTTHFMDEADVIADHIAIMSKGSLKATGSAAELKHDLGNGFEIIIPENALQLLSGRFSQFKCRSDRGRAVVQVPDSKDVAAITLALESYGLYDYHIQSPTIEDVFLSIAEEVQDSSNPQIANISSPAQESRGNDTDDLPLVGLDADELKFGLTPGKNISFAKQVQILLRKRFIVLRTQYFSYPCALLVPIVTSYLVTKFLSNFPYSNGIPCSSNGQDVGYSYAIGIAPYELGRGYAVYGPPSKVPIGLFEGLLKDHHIHLPPSVNSLQEFTRFIKQHRFNLGTGGFFIAPEGPVFAYLGSLSVTTAPVVLSALDNVLGSQLIEAQYAQFSRSEIFGSFQTLLLLLFMGLALCVYPAILGLYPSVERLQNVRALHFTNGIRSAPIWTAHILFDAIFIILISVAAVAIWAARYSGWFSIGCIAVVFILFGLTSTAFSYCISLFAKSPLACFAFTAAIQCAVLLISYAGYLMTEVFAPADYVRIWFNLEYFTIGLVMPPTSLLRALLMSLNEFSLLCRGKQRVSFPAAIDVYGGPILYLLLQFIALMAFVIYWDAGGRFSLLRRVRRDITDVEEKPGYETFEHSSRLSPDNDGLRVLNMSKAFGKVQAVQNITFGVQKSEAFALLGPNGAGKSTLISLIRGDFRPSNRDGDVFIAGNSLALHRAAARSHLGTCPQFDAIDSMTVIEHLRFYARARGVDNVEQNVAIVMSAVGLVPYKRRMAGALSGGNKRKLSLAISLIGNPAILILDEPSSGMDAAAKRVMWKVLSTLSTGRALVITTHSMEEADTLCDRAGIMAGHMLALGTTEELRNRYSNSSYVHLVHSEAPHTSDAHMEALRQWIAQMVPEAIMERRTFGGQLRFSVRSGSALFADHTSSVAEYCSAGSLFRLLESHKDQLRISQYTVGGATLDQVFLSVVAQHNVEEENYSQG